MDILSISGAAYLVAALLFILALAGLSKHETASQGWLYGVAGMTLALVATVLRVTDAGSATSVIVLVSAVAVGAVVGLWCAKRVQMTGMPELIALLHSFVGLAAVLIGWNGHLEAGAHADGIHYAEVFIGVFIGAVTFTGSVVAFLKLDRKSVV